MKGILAKTRTIMGKRFYCEFCDKSIPSDIVNRKKHAEGIQHQKLRKEYYAKYQSNESPAPFFGPNIFLQMASSNDNNNNPKIWSQFWKRREARRHVCDTFRRRAAVSATCAAIRTRQRVSSTISRICTDWVYIGRHNLQATDAFDLKWNKNKQTIRMPQQSETLRD